MVKISNGARVLYQWERGVKLTVTGQCDIVRMSREDDSGAKDFVPYKNGVEKEVEVPDFLLTESGYLRVSIIIRENDTERILETARFVIRPMQKSNNLAMSEQDVGSWLVLKMRMDALERAAREGKFNGDDGITPHIGENGNWYLADFDTGVQARGEDGITPRIGENGNWFVGESDTNVPATGDDGVTPHIGENGNWYIGDTDTGIKASGIHIGTEAPTSGENVWIDTDEEPEENGSTQIDVIAQPGQIIAVKEVDANGKPTKWEAIDLPKAKEPETPDFSANEGDAGYIKNRTHYVDEKGVIHKLPNMYIDAEWMATKEDGGAGKTVFIPEQTVTGGTWKNLQGSLTEGVTYAVEVNGILYRCECRSYDGTLYLGNGTLLGGTEHNNEPFCIALLSSTATGGMFFDNDTLESPVGIKVSDCLDEIYNKLPKEFVPETSWNDLTDRPIGKDVGELLFSHTANFATDGASERVLANGLTLTEGAEYWLEINGEMVKCHCESSSTVGWTLYDSEGNMPMKRSVGYIYIYGQTAGTYSYNLYDTSDDIVLDPRYIPSNIARKSDIPKGSGTGGTSIDVTAEVGQTIVVKEVDANGKPTKWESANYQPRTHWASDMVVIPETTLAVVDGMAVMETDFNYVVGKEYKVKFNGAEYLCTAFDIGAKLGIEVSVGAIGNFDAFAGTGDNGIPFISLREDALAFVVFDGSESVTLSVEEIVYNPIPAQYLPNAFPYYINVFGNGTTDDPHVCNETVENVEAIFNSGREIRLREYAKPSDVQPDYIVPNIRYLTVYHKEFHGMDYDHNHFAFVFGTGSLSNVGSFMLLPQTDGTYLVQGMQV